MVLFRFRQGSQELPVVREPVTRKSKLTPATWQTAFRARPLICLAFGIAVAGLATPEAIL
jgi:hypothetical protein